MGKGYAEGPAAEEAERRREELAAGTDGTEENAPATRLAVVGCTPDDPSRHVIGWLGDVDPDALFAAGKAWGLRVERRQVA
jgi:hypothetical protein